jgi:hypothetical protein
MAVAVLSPHRPGIGPNGFFRMLRLDLKMAAARLWERSTEKYDALHRASESNQRDDQASHRMSDDVGILGSSSFPIADRKIHGDRHVSSPFELSKEKVKAPGTVLAAVDEREHRHRSGGRLNRVFLPPSTIRTLANPLVTMTGTA